MKKNYIAIVCIILSACSSNKSKISNDVINDDEYTIHYKKHDPFEDLNRAVFDFNKSVDKYAIKSLTVAYRGISNESTRECISNFLHNLRSPLSAISHFLVLDFEGTIKSVYGFIINTLFGFLGCFDSASSVGFSVEEYNIKTVLKKYGMSGSPFIMLPLLGASSPRDIIGTVCNIFLDPGFYLFSESGVWMQNISEVINNRSDNFNGINDILYESMDPYGTVRDLNIEPF